MWHASGQFSSMFVGSWRYRTYGTGVGGVFWIDVGTSGVGEMVENPTQVVINTGSTIQPHLCEQSPVKHTTYIMKSHIFIWILRFSTFDWHTKLFTCEHVIPPHPCCWVFPTTGPWIVSIHQHIDTYHIVLYCYRFIFYQLLYEWVGRWRLCNIENVH